MTNLCSQRNGSFSVFRYYKTFKKEKHSVPVITSKSGRVTSVLSDSVILELYLCRHYQRITSA